MNYRWRFIVIAGLALAAVAALMAFVVCTPWLGAYPYAHFGWHPWGMGLMFAPLVFMLFCFGIGSALWRGSSSPEQTKKHVS